MSEYNTVVVNLLIALQRNMDKDIVEKMGYAGGNSGNIIFTEAVKSQLDYKKEIWLNKDSLKDVENPAVMIPSANFIRRGETSLMEAVLRFLDQTDCPVTMAGLGAQAGIKDRPRDLMKELSEEQKRTLKAVSERAVTLGVRGEFSAECLALIGIHNVRVIGCPSFYFRPVKALKDPFSGNAQVTITPGEKKQNLLVQRGREWDSIWMMQMLSELPQLIHGGKELSKENVRQIHQVYKGCKISDKELVTYMKNNSRIFFDKKEWDAYFAKENISFAYGSRFHGNMAAFRQGIPALWITHDMRTLELIETLHLPHIDLKEFKKIKKIEALIEKCDFSDCMKHEEKMHREYIRFLEENHLTRVENS